MKIGPIAFIRLLVMLRRIWQSVDKLAEIEQARLNLELDRMALDHPKWSQAGGKLPTQTKKAEFGVVDVKELNRVWEMSHPEE